MATMNKPAYAAIQTYSPSKPVLVFVSSRRQTRLTALDLIGFAAADERPQQFVHMAESELETIILTIKVHPIHLLLHILKSLICFAILSQFRLPGYGIPLLFVCFLQSI
jgi:hypothetical protein